MKNSSKIELHRLVEENLYNYILSHANVGQLTFDNGFIYLDTDFSHPFYNVCFIQKEKFLTKFQDVADLKRSARIAVSNKVDIEATKTFSNKFGFFYAEDLTCMYLDLGKTTFEAEKQEIVEYIWVKSLEELKLWLEPLSSSYRLNDESKNFGYKVFKNLMIGNEDRIVHILGLYEGKPVAAGTLFVDSKVAGLYNICTVPEKRNNGIGMETTKQMLCKAKDLGCEISVLQASQDGKNLYRQIGFKESGTQGVYIYLREMKNVR